MLRILVVINPFYVMDIGKCLHNKHVYIVCLQAISISCNSVPMTDTMNRTFVSSGMFNRIVSQPLNMIIPVLLELERMVADSQGRREKFIKMICSKPYLLFVLNSYEAIYCR